MHAQPATLLLLRSPARRFGPRLTLLFGLWLSPPLALANAAEVPAGTPSVAAKQAAAGAPANGSPWLPFKVKRGVAVDRRPAPGTRFFEYRASFTTPLTAAAVADLIWRNTTEVASNIVKKRDILRDTATERVFYDQVRTPVVSDRDYTLKVRKVVNPQRFQVFFETANELGPPVQPGFVRIPAIRGSWTAEPDGQGGTKLTYENFSEPGGSIPPFMVHGAQLDSVVDSVLRLQDKLRAVPRP